MNLTKDLKKNFMVIGGKDYYEISKFDRGYEGIEYCNLGGGFIKRIKINEAFMNDYKSGKIKFIRESFNKLYKRENCCY